MAAQNMVPNNGSDASLNVQSIHSRIEDEASSVLTTTVDGGSALTTAAAARRAGNNGSVRSRSRSPHPGASFVTTSEALGTNGIHELIGSKPGAYLSDTRDTSIELSSFLPSPDSFSATDISEDEHISHRNARHSGDTKALGDQSLRARLSKRWEDSKGLFMVVLAMFFTSTMGATARLMQTGPDPMHTFQILFARQSITTVFSLLFMWWRKIPDAPFGKKEVRPLLIARGFGGFFGVFGIYFSVQYVSLAEATVITFLAPAIANAVCAVILKEPFTRRERIACFISLIGVVFIARPFGFLQSGSENDPTIPDVLAANSTLVDTDSPIAHVPDATPSQRLLAVGASLLGVCGAACAYTTIRWIGKRAHPLVSVNYFSCWCTIVSFLALTFLPDISFRFPVNAREWGLLLSLGVSGFTMQSLLTAGLSRQKGSAATNMTYTQMIFVLLIDYGIFGTVLTWASWVGAALILCSQVWGAMARTEALKAKVPVLMDPLARSDEEVGLVDAQRGEELGDMVDDYRHADEISDAETRHARS